MFDQCIAVLKKTKKKLFTAESCTAGLICSSLAEIPGASAVLLGGIVCYDNRIKEDLLQVRPETLSAEGAVSFRCCREMLEGALQLSKADYVCAVTGIAGPGGGTPEKPVGTVFAGILCAEGGLMVHLKLPGSRQEVRLQTALAAVRLVCAWETGKDFEHLCIEGVKEIEPPQGL